MRDPVKVLRKPALLTGPPACAILRASLTCAEDNQLLIGIGIILRLAYRLRRHLWLGWSLARWFGSLLALTALVALIRWWSYPWFAASLGGLLLGYLLALSWAARRQYVHFRATPEVTAMLQNSPSLAPLRAEELVPLRVSGMFTVEGQDQYYVDLDAQLETVQSREHIVLACVLPSRFLLVGRWSGAELGWWYIFFQPAMIRRIDVGQLTFGPQARPAIRLIYATDDERQRHREAGSPGNGHRASRATLQTIYLACDEATALRRIWDDLRRDAPLEAVTSV
jgi:hypothetical protein